MDTAHSLCKILICVQAADRQRQDLPNPLMSIAPLFPSLPPPLDDPSFESPMSSRRSSQSDAPQSRPPSPPRNFRSAPPESAFEDPSFRTLPPPPGSNIRPFPLPSVHRFAYKTTEDGTEFDTELTYGGPSPKYTNSSDFVPWTVTRDWSTRDSRSSARSDLVMEGRSARRHIRVWQKKPVDEGYQSDGNE